jgi:hypothetical protein
MRSLGPFVALAALLAGCTTTGGSQVRPEPNSGPVTRAGCVATDPEGEVVLHPGTLQPGATTMVHGTRLIDPVNVAVIEASALASTGNPQVQGIVREYPPVEKAGLVHALADWETRRPLVELVIRPEDGRQAVLVAVRLVDPTQPGHLRGIRITSTGAGKARDDDLLQPVLLLPHGSRCDVAAYDSTTEWAG